eukprot:TRINITY_DN19764_c0_g1_i2.p1 TRINITY_DN19764_c0_g1~~TRINITY_DN19764_c0_g1_i2.p1  ORF type:complete len:185 (+),score=42.13 TRINITY_DN19764_c0_g1_i2:112-666(+)
MMVFFFFQAEDGIRDAQESRGLGDVYKRQKMLSKQHYQGVINFGCCGAYPGRGIAVGASFYIGEVRHFDVELPGDVHNPFDDRSFHLRVPSGHEGTARVCRTGWRFSRDVGDGSDCEDMELYGVASLCEAFELPLYAIKYVANLCNDSAHEDCEANAVTARANGELLLFELLSQTEGPRTSTTG